MPAVPTLTANLDEAIDTIIERIGRRIVLGLPLGLGKPVEFVNALYQRAVADPTIDLCILTALSLGKPEGSSKLERAFLAPFVAREFAGVPELDYLRDLLAQRLPPNVEVREFYFRPGVMLNNAYAQQRYISSNYTHVARDVFNQGCNVLAQMVCRREERKGTHYSLSCNPDTGPELVELLRQSGRPFVTVGVVNPNLPYMGNDAEVSADLFDIVIDNEHCHSTLFPTPKLAVDTADYAIGLNASCLVRDGGTLQIGIGALGDAIVHGLQMRHAHNADYRALITALGAERDNHALIDAFGGRDPFADGLYGSTEMFVDGFWHLLRSGILKRRVYDFWALQQLINEGRCDPDRLDASVLDELESLGVRVIRTHDFHTLQHHGLFNDDTHYDEGYIIAPDGTRAVANVADPAARSVMARCLGTRLRNGTLLHGGFFLGPREFYAGLNALDDDTRAAICMTGVRKINQLDFNPRLYQQQRQHARFINTGMLVTLSGAVCSDGLEDLRVVSGVGGQYNFVSMAQHLNTGRSILLIRAVRDSGGNATSNVVFNYGHTTIPRHLRDIVVTEYGIADLRSKTDSEVAQSLIRIADARFQPQLLAQAKAAGKIAADWSLPESWRHNTPERLEQTLAPFRARGLLPAFPFGCPFTDQELRLGKALKTVKHRAQTTPKWQLLLKLMGFREHSIPAQLRPDLQRLGLDQPETIEDRVARMLLVDALRAVS